MTSKKRKAQVLSAISKGLVKDNPFKPKVMLMQVDHPSGNNFIIDGIPVSESIFISEMKNQNDLFPEEKIEEEYY